MLMPMINLPDVTLIALTGKNFGVHQQAVDRSCEEINFGGVKIIWDESIKSIADWNRKIIFDLHKYFDTSHALLIHADGYVINPFLWRDEWLQYDYAGSPWPLPRDDYSYRDTSGRLIRVGNSVGLRSKKLMELIATRPMEFHYGNNNEDGQICCWERLWLEEQGCKFMPFEEALVFGKEHTIPENQNLETFLFHAL